MYPLLASRHEPVFNHSDTRMRTNLNQTSLKLAPGHGLFWHGARGPSWLPLPPLKAHRPAVRVGQKGLPIRVHATTGQGPFCFLPGPAEELIQPEKAEK
jgi:hypothetical protein